MATITISFNIATPAPSLGYLIKYRQFGTLIWSEITSTTSPVVIPVPDGTRYEGTIQSKCDDGVFGPAMYWEAKPCVGIQLRGGIGGGSYEYIDCGGNPQTGSLSDNEVVVICTDGSGYNTTSGTLLDEGYAVCLP